jgi:hypothetical protein
MICSIFRGARMGPRSQLREDAGDKTWTPSGVSFIYTAFRSWLAFCLHQMDVQPTKRRPTAAVDPSSQEVESFSIDSLLKDLETFQRRQQLETLDRIIMENSWLEHHIARYQANLSRTMKVLQEVYKAVALIRNGIDR